MNRNDLWLRLRALFLRRRMDTELEEELAAHLELQTRKHIQAGMSNNWLDSSEDCFML